MAKTIARITGTALRPGVSKNGRLYTAKQIKSAVERAQSRIVAGETPMTMLTHHLAGDDSVQIVGRLDKVTVGAAGEARYEASISDTPHGRTIASLADTTDGVPFLRNVSIRGGWLGEVRRVMVDDQMAETGDDLELDGLDFTKSPGVPGADIDSFTWTDAALPAESDGRALIYESAPAPSLQFTEDAPAELVEQAAALHIKAHKYADPGYRPDRMKRHALDTAEQAKSVWRYLNEADNARDYTATQLDRIKDRVKRALNKFGVTVDTTENWIVTSAQPISARALEMYDEPIRASMAGSFSVNVDNGVVSINVSSWRVDPADLEVCARAAMDGACKALAAMDPDEDGDIDVPGRESSGQGDVSENDAPESNLDPATTEQEIGTVADQPTPPAADAPQSTTPPAATPPAEVPAESPAAAGVHLTDDQFAQLLAKLGTAPAPAVAAPVAEKPAELVGAGAPAETAPVAGATIEVAPPVTETTEQMVARLVAEGIKAGLPVAIQEAAQAGGAPTRKGLVATTETAATAAEQGYPEGWPTDETGEPTPPHKMSREQADRLMRPNLEQTVLGPRSVYRQP